jgi:uncharacterized protein (UPF0262 family)
MAAGAEPKPGAGTAGGQVGAGERRTRIVALEIDAGSVVRWSPEVEHERSVAVFDLLERNHFRLEGGPAGPYRIVLSLRGATLVLAVEALEEAAGVVEIALPMRPFRRVIKDYFIICDSYYQAIRASSPSRIEAIDMARRGLHDEGAQRLCGALAPKAGLDHDTARRLFTLICVLHIRG